MRIKIQSSSPANFSGMGPSAWDRDTQKVSMHPPLPENIEHVEHDMQLHEHQSHIVHRRHPENDCDDELYREDISIEDLQQKPRRSSHRPH